MVPPLEIFRVEADGAFIWCACAHSVKSAVRRIEELNAKAPAKFVVVSPKTGHRRVFDMPGGPPSQQQSSR